MPQEFIKTSLAAMKFFRPEKLHFFKPILAGFKNGIKIPTTFSKFHEEALLKMNGQEWRVDVINDHFTGGGWRRFAEENDLESGGFIVFEHQGNMVFNAMIFDRISQCRTEPLIEPEFEVNLSDLGSGSDSEEVPDNGTLNLPSHFISTVKPHNIGSSKCYFYIPKEFARSSGLVNRNCEITLKDAKENSWHMNLKTSESGTRIQSGSKVSDFLTANGFKVGDSYKFELLAIGNGDHENPVVKITPQRMEVNVSESEDVASESGNGVSESEDVASESGNGVSESEDVASESENGVSESENEEYPYFTRTIKKYSMSNKAGFLNIPMRFARSNGLFRKQEMILMGKGGGRSRWRVKLWSEYSHFRMGKGWNDFRDANGIKEGDAFKFEIVKNGAVPVARFTVMVPGS